MARFWSTQAVLALVLLAGLAAPASAQSARSGSIEGVVRDTSGAPVGASVTVREAESGLTRTVPVSREGRFAIGVLPPGEYELRVEQFGFRPVVVTGVLLGPGQEVSVPVTLAGVAGVATQADTIAFQGAMLAASGPALAIQLPPERLREYPEPMRSVVGLGRYTALAGGELEMQGLPAAYSGVRVDGVRAYSPPSPGLVPGSLRGPALPISMFERATVVATDPDVEWSGFAGGSIDGYAWRGGRRTGLEAFGSWSGSALTGGLEGVDAGSYQSLQGGFRLSGSLVPDTASYVVGVEAWHLAGPLAPPLGTGAAAALAAARERGGIAASDPVGTTDVISGFGRFAWQLSGPTRLELRVSGAAVPTADGGLRAAPLPGVVAPYSGSDVSAALGVITRFGASTFQELSIGWDRTARDSEAADAFGIAGLTRVGDAATLGADAGFPAAYRRSVVHLDDALHFRRGGHRLKLGVAGAYEMADVERRPEARFFFPGLEGFDEGEGYLVATTAAPGGVSFSTARGSIFAQDRWSSGAGLQLLVGGRVDVQGLPRDEVAPDTAWFRATGLNTAGIHGSWARLSPRFGFSWDVQNRHEWVLSGSAGVYTGEIDPLLLSGWIEGGRRNVVRRGYGSLAGWPAAAGFEGATAARTLTLLDPALAPPRTARGSLGLSRAFGSGTVVQVAGLVRRTDLLPRFTDLNLLSDASATDQFGRPLLGRLRQYGSVLAVEPGSNRRFSGFDQVVAVELDGSSDYRALLVSFDHRAAGGLDVYGSYAYSRTEDDWVPADGTGLGLPLAPVTGQGDADWMQGTSSFDVPHRLALGADADVPVLEGLRAGVLYRYRSGRPFTPTFGDAVDANGDGVAGNDPAYIDESLLGGLLGGWSCLRDGVGAVAARNSCRADAVQSLDVRLALAILRSHRYTARLVVDALNLLASREDVPDRALYRVDASRRVTTDPATGRVTLPLIANEHFGQPLGSVQTGRALRLGFQLAY